MGVLATPLIHDVELDSDGITSRQSSESRALRSVLRNHAEGYALLCFHSCFSDEVGDKPRQHPEPDHVPLE